MPTDPGILLQSGNFGAIPQTVIGAAIGAEKLRMLGQERQGQDALRQLYADPANLDARGNPQPQAMRRLMAIAPETGIDLRRALTADSMADAQLALMRAKEGDESLKQRFMIGQAGLSAYGDAMAAGATPTAARKAGQDAFTDARDALAKSGAIGPETLATIPPDFDPARVQRGVSAYERMTKDPVKLAKDTAEAQKAQVEAATEGPLRQAQTQEATARAAKDAASVNNPSKQYGNPVPLTVRATPDGKAETVWARQDKAAPGPDPTYVRVGGPQHGQPIDPKTITGIQTPTAANQPELNQNALDVMSTQLLSGDPAAIHSMGFGGSANRVQILNAAADKAVQQWGKEDAGRNLAAVNAMFAADKSSLGVLSKLRNNVENFENTAIDVANRALELAPKGLAGQSPAINRWIQAGRTSIKGDADVSALNVAVTDLVGEYARIMSSPGASGGTTSDHARATANEIINKAMNADQFKAAIDTMKQTLAYRVGEIKAQMGAVIHDIQSGGGVSGPLTEPTKPTGTPAEPAAARQPASAPPVSMLKEGFVQKFKDGSAWTLENGQPKKLN